MIEAHPDARGPAVPAVAARDGGGRGTRLASSRGLQQNTPEGNTMDRARATGPGKSTHPPRPRSRTPSKPDRTLPERRKPEPERPASPPSH